MKNIKFVTVRDYDGIVVKIKTSMGPCDVKLGDLLVLSYYSAIPIKIAKIDVLNLVVRIMSF